MHVAVVCFYCCWGVVGFLVCFLHNTLFDSLESEDGVVGYIRSFV